MDRLERVHRKANTEHKKNLIKRIYYDKYVIKKENIPFGQDANIVISTQKERISQWLDYLTDENAKYPMWAKYWAFQGMLRMGNYDELKGIYSKRSSKTVTPFIEVNPELVAACIDNVIKMVNKDNLTENELNGLIEIESFQKLYTLLEKKNKEKNRETVREDEGVWVKYNKGSRDDAIKLSRSLEGMNTGWCTASTDTAISQLCGGGNYRGGDFYVFYTKQNDEFVVPRIAIRLDGSDRIGEIRGISEGQNLEETMIKPLEKKLSEMAFLSKRDVEKEMKKVRELKELHTIGEKTANNINLTEDEVIGLYTRKYGFGWENDPKVKKIQNLRNIKDDYHKLNNRSDKKNMLKKYYKELDHVESDIKLLLSIKIENEIPLFELSDKKINSNKKIVKSVISQYPDELNYVSEELKNDKEVVLAAVNNDGRALSYASEELKNDKEVVLVAVRNFGDSLGQASEELKNDKEVVLSAVRNRDYAFTDASENLRKDRDTVVEAIEANAKVIDFIDRDIYDEVQEDIKEFFGENIFLYNRVSKTIRAKLMVAVMKRDIEAMNRIKEDIIAANKDYLNFKEDLENMFDEESEKNLIEEVDNYIL